ncbi:tetratricopeptide repeat protein, partial [Acinetobacter baumannii]
HPTSAELIAWYRAIAQLYIDIDRFALAEPLLKKVITLKENSLGSVNEDLADYLDEVSAAFSAQGKHTQAEELLQRSVKIREELYGVSHLN